MVLPDEVDGPGTPTFASAGEVEDGATDSAGGGAPPRPSLPPRLPWLRPPRAPCAEELLPSATLGAVDCTSEPVAPGTSVLSVPGRGWLAYGEAVIEPSALGNVG